MPSNIDETLPAEGTAFTSDMRANFAAAKAEIEQLQTIGALTSEIDIKNYLSAAELADVQSGGLTIDLASVIQSAIDNAEALTTYTENASVVSVRLPAGAYRVDSQITIEPHVLFRGEGVIYNNLGTPGDPCVVVKAGAYVERLIVNANSQYGVRIGEAGIDSKSYIGFLKVFNGASVAGRHAVNVIGSNITIDTVDTEGGDVGLMIGDGASFAGGANYIYIGNVRSHLANIACRIYGGQGISILKLNGISCHELGLDLDGCHDIQIPAAKFIYLDGDAGTIFTLGAMRLGSASAAEPVTAAAINATITNTDNTSPAVDLHYMEDSKMNLLITDATLDSGNANPIGTGLRYNTGFAASNLLIANIDASITQTSGTEVGGLIVWSGTTLRHSHGIAATEFSPTIGNYRGQILVAKNATESVTSSIVLQDEDELAFAVGANQNWHARWVLRAGAALSTTGIQLAITTPVGGLFLLYGEYTPDIANAANRPVKSTSVSGTAINYTAAELAGCGSAVITLHLRYIGSANAGFISLQFCQSTSSATPVSVLSNSILEANRVS